MTNNIDTFDVTNNIDTFGMINTSHSITSAIKQSDLVIIPIFNEIKSLSAGIGTIQEIIPFNKNIMVIATKLQKTKGEVFTDWKNSNEYQNIDKIIRTSIDLKIPILPLKFSKVFDTIFEKESSINQIIKTDRLAAFTYREVAKQFNDIYDFIDKY